MFYLMIAVAIPSFSQHCMSPVFSDSTQSFQAHFEKQLEGILKKDTGKYNFEAAGFIRFKIDTSGNIINFECSYKIDARLKSILNNCTLLVTHRWYPCVENGNKVVSDFVTIPVIVAANKYPLDKIVSLADFVSSFAFEPYDHIRNNKIAEFDPAARFTREKGETSGQLYLPPIFYYYSTTHKGSKKIK